MIRKVAGVWRSNFNNTVFGIPYEVTVADGIGNGQPLIPQPPCTWTSGAVLIDNVQQPSEPYAWQVLSLAVTAYLVLDAGEVQPITANRYFGKFGKIFTGLTVQPPTPYSLGQNWAYENELYVPLPSDSTQTVELWDPATDDLPPQRVYPQTPGQQIPNVRPLPITATLTLPQPLSLQSGSTLGVGLWMIPSLLSCDTGTNGPAIGLVITSAQYAINFSAEGGTSNPTWSPSVT